MSERRTAALAAALALLAAYYVGFERESGGERDRPPAATLVDCGPDAPAALAVTTPAGRREARRDGTRWVTGPGRFAPAAFASLAEAVCRLPVLDRVPTATPPAELGLAPPHATIEALAANRTQTVDVGDATPAGNRGYARGASGELIVVGAELRAVVDGVLGAAAP